MRKIGILLFLMLVSGGCTSSNAPSIFTRDAKCSPPCWYGLKPGQSTLEESRSILKAAPFVVSESIQIDTYLNPSDYVFWQFTGNASGEGRLYFDSNGTLKRIVLNPNGQDLGAVIDAFGTPEKIWPVYRRQPTGPLYQITLFYPEHGIVVEGEAKAQNITGSNKEDLSRDIPITQIDFFVPTEIQRYLTLIAQQSERDAEDMMKHLQSWPGFGKGIIQVLP